MKLNVIRSSAGAGKTYSLVRQFLLYILGSPDPRYYKHVLAITFTNKATNEMKDRLILALDGISKQDPNYNEMRDFLADKLNVESNSLVERCSIILSLILHDYGELSISTIDRFVYRIIRSFSFELDVPSNVEIELKKDRLKQSVIDSLFDELSENEKLEKILVEFSDFKYREDKSTNISIELLELAGEVMDAKADGFLQLIKEMNIGDFITIRNNIKNLRAGIENPIKEKAAQMIKTLKDNGISEIQLAYGKSGVFGYINKLIAQSELELPGKNVEKILQSGKWTSSKCTPEDSRTIEFLQPELETLLSGMIDELDTNFSLYNFILLLQTNIYSMAIAHEVHRKIIEYKTAFSTAQLEDFNQLISRLIQDTPVPFIYERIGEKYHHYLIDEFQDTSEVQWYNLSPLLENALSEGHDSFIVGDAKQAIYRFRGGAAGQLVRLPQLEFPNIYDQQLHFRSQLFVEAFEAEILEFNRRSAPEIVNFVNAFFQNLKEKYPAVLTEVYTEHTQKIIKDKLQGSVEINFLGSDITEDERIGLIVNRIDEFKKCGYGLGDISIICRKRDQCSKVAHFLLDKGIPVVSAESLQLKNAPAIKALINWLSYLYEGAHQIPAYSILEYLFDKKFEVNASERLFKRWNESPDFKKILSELGYTLNYSDLFKLTIFEVLGVLINTFEPEGPNDAFLSAFLDQVNQFQNKQGSNIPEFLEWWRENLDDLVIELPDVSDAVNIITAHKAKGLEFRIVIVPFMYNSIRNSNHNFWVKTEGDDQKIIPIAWLPANKRLSNTHYAQLLENEENESFLDTINLIYVTLTRAREHLVVLSKDSEAMKGERNEAFILSQCIEMTELNQSGKTNQFFMGNRSINQDKSEPTVNPKMIDQIPLTESWHSKLMLEFRSENIKLKDYERSAKEKGKLVHEILAEMLDLNQLDEILERAKKNAILNEALCEEVLTSISSMLNQEEIRKYYSNFQGKIFNERDLVNEKGEKFRPDRCCIEGDNAVIFDYKTGEIDEDHNKQVLNYISLFQQLGFSNCRGYLLYLSSGQVRRVA